MAIENIPAIIRIRRGTLTEWNNANPILQNGEASYVTDKNKIKVGDGITTWKLLPYIVGIDGIPPGGTTGDLLIKLSDEDYDIGWQALEGQI